MPGGGKTTLIRKLADKLDELWPVGFYTAEIREKGTRRGFELIALDGRKTLLSHVKIKSRYRVGKYGVDLDGFERFLESIDFFQPNSQIVVIDEVGKMECFSPIFRDLLRQLLDAGKPLLATIASKGGGIISEVKSRADIRLFEITTGNRDILGEDIFHQIKVLLVPET